MKQLTLPYNLNQTGEKIGTSENYGQAEMPEWEDQASKHQYYKKMKTTVSEKVSFENETFWREHTETLIKQGHFLCLAMLEKSDTCSI